MTYAKAQAICNAYNAVWTATDRLEKKLYKTIKLPTQTETRFLKATQRFLAREVKYLDPLIIVIDAVEAAKRVRTV